MGLFQWLLIVAVYATAVIYSDDCVFNLKHKEKNLQFDLTRFEELQKVNFTKSNDVYLINIKLCKNNEQKSTCDGIKTKICLIKNKNNFSDIGSKIKEIKLDVKDQLILSLEGNTICDKNQKFTTEITFICDKNINENRLYYKPNSNRCKYVIEITSAVGCPVDDLDLRNVCNVSIPHSNYKFNLNPLRRLTSNYLVINKNRQFEVNICGRLTDNSKCKGNTTTICDITDKPKVYAVGNYRNDKLLYDPESRNLKLIQHEKFTRKQGRRIEFIFKCDENISPEISKPTFLRENYQNKNASNIAYFEVATSVVCIPRQTLCEVATDTSRFNLNPLHKRVGNWKIMNVNNDGIFYLNICGYLNEYGEKMPAPCTVGGKTSACYVDSRGKGISIGSTQIGPYVNGSSIILHYTDGNNCSNSLKWSTMLKLTCSDESKLIHKSTNFRLCTHEFNWKSPKACEILFQREDRCMVTHPQNFERVYNFSNLKNQAFEKYIDENTSFRFSICSPLQKPCNGIIDSAACWSVDGTEINIGLFTEQVLFDNGFIYMSMQGETCVNDGQGPNSYTTIRFVCDYLDSKWIVYQMDSNECTFEFIIYTKYACTQPSQINCTVEDQSGNMFDLSKLTKFNSNYEIITSQKNTIILNVCHSVINNDINGVSCQFDSGVCLVKNNNLLFSERYKDLGKVKESPRKEGNKLVLEMNSNMVSSVIEFICSNQTNGPLLTFEDSHKYVFQWLTPLVCPNYKCIEERGITKNDHTLKPTHTFKDHRLNYCMLEWNIKLNNLTPIKGNHIILSSNGIKYYINICRPEARGIEGIMEFKNKNYSIGYQETPFKNNVEDIVEIYLKNGDSCLDLTSKMSKTKYSTKITLLCDITEAEGKPILVDIIGNCTLQFEWKTRLVCSRKFVEFNRNMCAATVKMSSLNVIDNKTIDLNNILRIKNLSDDSTKTNYLIDFCNASVCLNGTTFFGNMNLKYDVYKKQLIANFQSTTDTYLKNVDIIVTCSKSTKELSTYKITSTDNGVRIDTYSKGVCCIDFNNHTNEEINESIPLPTTNTVESQLSVNSENYESIESDEPITSTTVQTEESFYTISPLIVGKDIVISDNFTDMPIMKKEVSGSSFYTGIVLLILIVIPLTWIYRWKLLKEIRKWLHYLLFVRRKRGSYRSG